MSTTDSPVAEPARQRPPAIEPDQQPDRTETRLDTASEPKKDAGTDFGSRLGLTAGTPQETLRFLGDITRNANSAGLPEAFGRFDLAFNGSDLTGLLNGRSRQEQRERADDPTRTERTRIFGTGSRRDTQVEIRYGADNKPNFVRDHLGEWKSEDGGRT